MFNAINDFCLLNFGISIHAMSISIRTVYFYQREIIKKKKDYLWVKLISCLGAFSLLKNLRFLFYFTCTFSFPPNWSGSAILSKKCCLADFQIWREIFLNPFQFSFAHCDSGKINTNTINRIKLKVIRLLKELQARCRCVDGRVCGVCLPETAPLQASIQSVSGAYMISPTRGVKYCNIPPSPSHQGFAPDFNNGDVAPW